MNNITGAIKHLIIINVILFVGPQFMKLDFSNLLALHFPKNEHFGIWNYLKGIETIPYFSEHFTQLSKKNN